MAPRWLIVPLLLFIHAMVVAIPAFAATHSDPDAPVPHSRVRASSSDLIQNAIDLGRVRSKPFRELVETIDASDGLVYVDEGRCGGSIRGCLLHSVTLAGPFRLLRIRVAPDRAPACELTALIGHELQHAIEVLRDPQARSDRAIVGVFARIGLLRGARWFETDEALTVGDSVWREACHGRHDLPRRALR